MSISSVTQLSLKKNLLPTVDSWCGSVNFFRLYGAQLKFLIPGDVWRETTECFIRFMPMLSPSLTPYKAKVRHFVVPLRLVEPDLTELIITGSKDGVVSENEIPQFPDICSLLDSDVSYYVHKDSILHVIFGLPIGYEFDNSESISSLPRLYWLKAYCRIWWDYYRDENVKDFVLSPISSDDDDYKYTVGDDFEDFFDYVAHYAHNLRCLPICLPKDYIFGSLPWQLKGTQPTLNFGTDVSLHWANTLQYIPQNNNLIGFSPAAGQSGQGAQNGLARYGATMTSGFDNLNNNIQTFLDNIDGTLDSATLNADKLRDLLAQTRILERLARTGSRYTEYLRGNFGVSPADGTLQRAVYLGGYKQDILTTEVLQTGTGDTPVGTMRGHGISNARNTMAPYFVKEFSLFFTTFEIEPQIQYTQGISRELTYKSRWEFFNPSFQHLSEQEVRNGEVYISNDGKNDETFGFRGMYDELRSGKRRYFGSMLTDLAYWNSAIQFRQRPNLNGYWLNGTNYSADFLRPFGLRGEGDGNPVIVDLYCRNTPLRPIVKEGIPLI